MHPKPDFGKFNSQRFRLCGNRKATESSCRGKTSQKHVARLVVPIFATRIELDATEQVAQVVSKGKTLYTVNYTGRQSPSLAQTRQFCAGFFCKLY